MTYAPEPLDDEILDIERIRTITENDSSYSREFANMTPLMEMCYNNDLNGLIKLLDEGANINKVGFRGYTVLILAAKYDNLEIMEELLFRGASVEIKDAEGNTFMDHVKSWRKEIIEYMDGLNCIKPAKK